MDYYLDIIKLACATNGEAALVSSESGLARRRRTRRGCSRSPLLALVVEPDAHTRSLDNEARILHTGRSAMDRAHAQGRMFPVDALP